MYVTSQLIDFIEFVIIGAIIGAVFDFFRAYRKVKKTNTALVITQDILLFLIVTVIVILSIIKLLDSQIRLYIFIAIIMGLSIYFCILSKIIISIDIAFIKMFKQIVTIIFLPILLHVSILRKIGVFLKKMIKKCCKMFLFMLSFICKRKNEKDFDTNCDDKNKRGIRLMETKKNTNDLNSNKKKSVKKRKLGLMHVFVICFMLYFTYTFIDQQIQINKYDSKIKMYSADIKAKKDLTEYYNNQKGSTNSDEYIENVARESLGYVKPYEKIFIDVNK